MPARNSNTASTAAPTAVSERLELAKAISNMANKADTFIAATESYKTFSKDTLVKLDLDIEAKRLELDDLRKEIEHNIKNGKIDVDVALREYKREGAVAMLKEMNETVISDKDLNNMQRELKDLRENLDNATATIKKEEAEKREKAISQATRNMELQHKAANATIIALSKQREREIANLKSSITDLRNEISAQRELTRSVAEAGRHVSNYIPQPQSVRSWSKQRLQLRKFACMAMSLCLLIGPPGSI